VKVFSEIRRTAKHAVIYGFGLISYRLVGFFLLPLYTRKINVAEYGLFGLLEVSGQILASILLLGLPPALFRWLSLAKDSEEQRQVVTTVVVGLLLIDLPVLGLLTLWSLLHIPALLGYFPEAGLTSQRFSWLLLAFYADVFVTLLIRVQFNLLRAEERSLTYSAASLLRFLLVMALTILFVARYGLGIVGIYLGQVAGSLFIFLLLMPFFAKYLAPSLNVKILPDMLRYGTPLILMTINILVLNMGNRFLLERLGTLGEVGQYTVGQKIGNILHVALVQPFTFAYFPMIWKVYTSENSEGFFRRTLTYFVFVAGWGVLFFALFGPEITRFFARTPSYFEAYRIVPLISLAAFLYGVVYILHTSFHLTGKTYWISLTFITGLIANLALNFWTIPRWGIVGAAWAVVAGYGLVGILSYPLAMQCYPIRYEGIRLLKVGGTAVSLYAVSCFLPAQSSWITVMVKVFLLALFPLLLWGVGFLDSAERARLKSLRILVRGEPTRPV